MAEADTDEAPLNEKTPRAGPTSRLERARRRLRRTRWDRVLLTYAVIVNVVPLRLLFPTYGLDPSWTFALGRAVQSGLVFGQDIVYTYGPLGPVATGVYDPGLGWWPVAWGMLLTAGTLLAGAPLIRRLGPLPILGLTALLLVGLFPASSYDLVIPFLVVANVHMRLQRSPSTSPLPALAVMGASVATLPLIKLSTLPLYAVCLLAGAALLLRSRQWTGAGVLVGAALVAVPLLWISARQPLSALPAYVSRSMQIVSGYSDAMSKAPVGMVSMAIAFLVCSALLTWALLVTRGMLSARAAMAVTAAATLFVSFKGAFSREAPSHVLLAVPVVLVVGVVICVLLENRLLALGVSGLCLLLAASTYVVIARSSPGFQSILVDALRANVVDAPGDTVRRALDPGGVRHDYARAIARIRRDDPLPPLAHGVPTDLYSFDQSALFAAGLQWDPRPVFQSYVAYTPELLRLNAEHLTEGSAPAQILMRIEPVDFRLPALEDGASWLPLLRHYSLKRFDEATNYVVLTRRETPVPVEVGQARQTSHRLGTTVRLPAGEAYIATLDVQPTTIGRLLNLAYRAPALAIEVTTADGHTYHHRLVAAMARSPFLLSPYVATSENLAHLFDQRAGSAPMRVQQIRVLGDTRAWASTYTLSLRAVSLSTLSR